MDPREAIVNRLFEIIDGIAAVATAGRNRIEFDDSDLPAASVLEGDEDVESYDHGKPIDKPYIVTATPQIFIRTMAAASEVGTDFSALRAAVIKAVLQDATLKDLTLNKRSLRYAGMNTNALVARSIMGAGALVFTIKYEFKPNDL